MMIASFHCPGAVFVYYSPVCQPPQEHLRSHFHNYESLKLFWSTRVYVAGQTGKGKVIPLQARCGPEGE